MSAALLNGFGLGFLVAAEVGPVWLLCVHCTLGNGWRVGVGIGGGAALIDMLYAGLAAVGAAALLQIAALKLALGIAGLCILGFLGASSLAAAVRVRPHDSIAGRVSTPGRALLTALAVTASNPLTILSWAALLSTARSAEVAASAADLAVLVAGVGAGSFLWFALLSSVVTATRRAVTARVLRVVDGVAGAGLLAFAGVLAYRLASVA